MGRRGTGAGNEEEWRGDESITILIVPAHTAAHTGTLFRGEHAHAFLLLHGGEGYWCLVGLLLDEM